MDEGIAFTMKVARHKRVQNILNELGLVRQNTMSQKWSLVILGYTRNFAAALFLVHLGPEQGLLTYSSPERSFRCFDFEKLTGLRLCYS